MAANQELEALVKKLQEQQGILRAQAEEQAHKNRALEGRFLLGASFPDVLELENGHTVWARTRYMQMTPQRISNATNSRMEFVDGATAIAIFSVKVPADWVLNTNMILHANLINRATAGTPNAYMYSDIHVAKAGEVSALFNFEAVTGVIV